MRIPLIKILVAFLAAVNVYAQNSSELSISGYVVDESTAKPLPYANILLAGSNIGTVTNIKGEFKLSIPIKFRNDNLVISYVGYKTDTVAIASVLSDSRIVLKESEQTLDEVLVTEQSALSLIKTAIEKIPVNYYAQPYKSRGFYRVTSLKDAKYMHLSEAVFELHNDRNASQFKLIKMRAIKDEKESHGLELGLKPNGVIEFDMINHPGEFDFLSEKGLKDYDFEFEDHFVYMDREVFVLSFDHKSGIKKAGYKGKMYIDVDTDAIVYMDFGLAQKEFNTTNLVMQLSVP